jgi:NAD(P)-dependent dehydrogenase (short-subunit alcohol dehydrogenase family)
MMRSTTRVVLLFVLELLQVGGFAVPRGMALSMSGGGTVRKLALSEQRPSEFYPQFFENLPSMAGKTVVVTGASRGLGYVTALSLAKKSATVIMLCRRSERADQALANVAAAAAGCAPTLVHCNLLDFDSVRAAASVVSSLVLHSGLDALCLNAGIMMQPDEASKDGYDITMSTNVLSHFLLTRELMPALEQAASSRGEARVVSMSSGSGFGPPAFDARFLAKQGGNLGGWGASYERYHQSKLSNLIFTAALHDKLVARASSVKALACTPGVCATGPRATIYLVLSI